MNRTDSSEPANRGDDALEHLPPLSRDPSFWAMTGTQLFGAFNDTIFRQLVLLLLVRVVVEPGGTARDQQAVALMLFAVPFILFSGSAGWLADRISKRRIVVWMKLTEVGVMLGGLAAFLTMPVPVEDADGNFASLGVPWLVLVVLFLMGTQSAVFGPAKYGILPEMVRGRDLPAFNGIINMTTFLALIFGVGVGGWLMDSFRTALWMAGLFCVALAVVGTLTSLLVRSGPPAKPKLPYTLASAAISRETWKMITGDRVLLGSLLTYSLFWFVGGIVPPAVNALGRLQIELDNTWTSIMTAHLGLGIAVGCLLAGKLSRKEVNFRLVTIGAVGVIACLAGLTFGPPAVLALPDDWHLPGLLQLFEASGGQLAAFYLSSLLLGGAGVFAGLYVVPLQVFLQSRPPKNQKGRMIGSMNLINWIGIALSGLVYQACSQLVEATDLPHSAVFLITAATLVPVILLFRPPNAKL